MYDEKFAEKDQEYPYQVINDKESIEKILSLYIEKYYGEKDDKQQWFDKIKELAGEMVLNLLLICYLKQINGNQYHYHLKKIFHHLHNQANI